jgi:hypothetical protein
MVKFKILFIIYIFVMFVYGTGLMLAAAQKRQPVNEQNVESMELIAECESFAAFELSINNDRYYIIHHGYCDELEIWYWGDATIFDIKTGIMY